MTCGYDTQTVLERLFDIDTDNGINSDSIYGNSNRDSSCSDSCAYELIARSLFNLYVKSTKC